MLTIIPLSDPILDPSSFGQVGDLRPVLVRIGTGAERAAGTVVRRGVLGGSGGRGVWHGVRLMPLHGGQRRALAGERRCLRGNGGRHERDGVIQDVGEGRKGARRYTEGGR